MIILYSTTMTSILLNMYDRDKFGIVLSIMMLLITIAIHITEIKNKKGGNKNV
ncbi:MAG: hypothetical protein ACRCVJ_18665 [Clostridium sp.]|uniref:hypothetical protein n=1 Tax=Clostridium sp. TaxID=1506 RepID=UPI003F37180A